MIGYICINCDDVSSNCWLVFYFGGASMYTWDDLIVPTFNTRCIITSFKDRFIFVTITHWWIIFFWRRMVYINYFVDEQFYLVNKDWWILFLPILIDPIYFSTTTTTTTVISNWSFNKRLAWVLVTFRGVIFWSVQCRRRR